MEIARAAHLYSVKLSHDEPAGSRSGDPRYELLSQLISLENVADREAVSPRRG